MSIAMNLDRVSLTYISEPVFENLFWEIHDDRCVGLVGPNGCGKSTLLRLIPGELASDTGYRLPRKGLSIGYLPQEPRLAAGRSVWHEALTASARLAQIEADWPRSRPAWPTRPCTATGKPWRVPWSRHCWKPPGARCQ